MKPISINDNDKRIGKYSVAPYNFVSFPNSAVIKYNGLDELPVHNNFKSKDNKKLLNGYIEYKLRAETPIIVSSGTDEKNAKFFMNSDGKYAIPGNSIRGMLRTNAQILSFSSVVGCKDEKGEYKDSDIEDSRYLYRDVAGNNSLSEKYKNVLGIDNNRRITQSVQVGYIIKEREKYYIQPAKKVKEDVAYLRVDEILLRKICDKDFTSINFMYEAGLVDHENELKELNQLIANTADRHKKNELKDRVKEILKDYSEKAYLPYKAEISFEYDNIKLEVTKVGKRGQYNFKGYILSGGFILGKRSHYIVMEEDNLDRIEIPKHIIDAYKDDLILTKKKNKKEDDTEESKKSYEEIKKIQKNKFFVLPIDNERKPVFYLNHDNKMHFGFTPYLRVLYGKSVLEGIAQEYKEDKGISYTDAIFGFSNRVNSTKKTDEKFSYKSRVGFDDAVAIGIPQVDEDSIIKIILAEPKATSYNLYLRQDENADKKNLKIYEDDFSIRGIKQYWMKSYVEGISSEKDDPKKNENDNMSITIYPLKEGTCFKGKIYFTNLEEEELGLLSWSLKLNDGCFQNIGLAKPYGFGRVKVESVELKIENIDKKYESFSFDYLETDNVDKYIKFYKDNFATEKIGGKSLDDQKPIKELMTIKSRIVSEKDAKYYRYMEMKLKEFRDRKVLPEILHYDDLVRIPDEKKGFNRNSPRNPKHIRDDSRQIKDMKNGNGYNGRNSNEQTSNLGKENMEKLLKLKMDMQ